MNKRSNVEKKAAFDLTEEEFGNLMDQKRSSENSSFEDSALEKFIKEPSKSDLCDNIKLKPWDFFLLAFLLLIMLFASVVGGSNGGMEIYVAIPIAFLSFLGFLILIRCAKQHGEENKKKYK